MHTPRQAWLGWLPVVVWMGLIFSASTDPLSAAHTSRFVEPFLRWLFQGHLSEHAVGLLHFLLRKCAHLTEYAVLAVLTWNALRRSSTAYPNSLAVLVCALYAASDEFHQSFTPSREASVRDVLIDTVGAMVGLLVLRGCRQLLRSSPDRI